MKKIIQSLLKVFAVFALVISCKKQPVNTTPSNPTVNDTETVISTITGQVFDENNEPMMGATVTLGSTVITTDALGSFEFKNMAMSKNNAHIKVVKAGYFNGNRSMLSKAGETQVANIKLMPRTIAGTVNASSGGAVTLTTGGKVTFPTNAFVDLSGNPYTGTVNVAMAWLNPTAPDLGQIMQGDLRGITTTGSETGLQTYGMLNVELTSTSGQELKIATGKTAELRFPLPSTIQAGAPATIPLWFFDETKGRWIEEGSATKIGTEYAGTVKHFTFWNVDMPGVSTSPLTFSFADNTGVLLTNLDIKIITSTGVTIYVGQTNNLGRIYPVVTSGILHKIVVFNKCGLEIHTADLGSFFIVPSPGLVTNVVVPVVANKITITGTAYKCDLSSPITNGFVKIQTSGGLTFNVPVNALGQYSFTNFSCGSDVSALLQATDNATGIVGDPKLLTFPVGAGTQTGVDLFACATSTIEYVSSVIKGKPHLWIVPTDDLTTAYNVPATHTARADISAMKFGTLAVSALAQPFLITKFPFNATTGAYPIEKVRYESNSIAGTTSSQVINTPSPLVNLTRIDAAGPSAFIEGNYSVNMQFLPSSTAGNVYTRFRVKRP
jgi:Carboxypeptidase regulatory-like domain